MLYKINALHQDRPGHAILLVPPLTLLMIFCFALVLIQPHSMHAPPAPSASRQSTPVTTFTQPVLSNLAFAPAVTLPTINPVTLSNSVADSAVTANPQSVPSVDNQLQAASTKNQQTAIPMQSIINVPKATLLAPTNKKVEKLKKQLVLGIDQK